MDIFQAAVWLIDSKLRLVFGNIPVRILAEVFGKDDLIGPCASHGESIAYDSPLRLSIQAKALPKVMDKSNQHHPAGMTVFADRLRGLQQMFDLSQVSIWVAVIDQSVQEFSCLPDTFLAAC